MQSWNEVFNESTGFSGKIRRTELRISGERSTRTPSFKWIVVGKARLLCVGPCNDSSLMFGCWSLVSYHYQKIYYYHVVLIMASIHSAKEYCVALTSWNFIMAWHFRQHSCCELNLYKEIFLSLILILRSLYLVVFWCCKKSNFVSFRLKLRA